MIRQFLLKPLLFIICILSLAGCKGTHGSDQIKEESRHITNETALELPGREEEASFRQSALDGELEKVKMLLKQGVDSNAADEEGRTALMLASYNGHSEIVLVLLDDGAEIDRRDSMDRTALIYGATGSFPETVRILLENGADPNIVDSGEHFSPLMYAAAEGHLEVVKELIQHGAKRNLLDVDGDDAATFAEQNGHIQVAEYLKQEE
jgi:ankyrin repeat protein